MSPLTGWPRPWQARRWQPIESSSPWLTGRRWLRHAACCCAALAWTACAGPLEQGFLAYQQGDYEKALNVWLPLAEEGDATAQFNLGQMYRLGKGVPQDDDKAAEWYVKAARKGSTEARHNLRLMYREGRVSPEDFTRGFGFDVAPVQPAAGTAPEASGNPDWLQRLDPKAYLVQLLAVPDRQEVEQLLAAHRAGLPAREAGYTRIRSQGREWYVLLMGPFPDAAAARAAIARLSPGLRRNEPWIRRVEAILAAGR